MRDRKLINLTGHPLHLLAQGQVISIEPAEVTLRVKQRHTPLAVTPQGIPIVALEFGELDPNSPEELPGWHEGAIYVVSLVTALAVMDNWEPLLPGCADRFFTPASTVRSGSAVVARALAAVGETERRRRKGGDK